MQGEERCEWRAGACGEQWRPEVRWQRPFSLCGQYQPSAGLTRGFVPRGQMRLSSLTAVYSPPKPPPRMHTRGPLPSPVPATPAPGAAEQAVRSPCRPVGPPAAPPLLPRPLPLPALMPASRVESKTRCWARWAVRRRRCWQRSHWGKPPPRKSAFSPATRLQRALRLPLSLRERAALGTPPLQRATPPDEAAAAQAIDHNRLV